MANIYLEYNAFEDVKVPLGYVILGTNELVTQVTASIQIEPERPFLYWGKRLLSYLNSGVISQDVYDLIIELQNNELQWHEIESDYIFDKNLLSPLIERYLVNNVDFEGGTLAEIVEDINNEGYQIIIKL